MINRRVCGRATGGLLFFLLLLLGLGAWNAHRNGALRVQAEGSRPYGSYAVEDLEALREAYLSELEVMRGRFGAAKDQRVRPRGDLGSISDNVAQFERTTQVSSAIRQAAADVAERKRRVAALDRELEMRGRFGQRLMWHVNRLMTF